MQIDLATSALLSRSVLDGLNVSVLVERAERIVYINSCYADLLGYRIGELLGRHISCLIVREDRKRLIGFSRCRVSEDAVPSRYPFHAAHKDGSAVALTASVSTLVIGRELLITTVAHPREQPQQRPDEARLSCLTPRERDVFDLLLEGRRQKEIGRILEISEKTISTHRTRLFEKMQFGSVRDLFRFAYDVGLLS